MLSWFTTVEKAYIALKQQCTYIFIVGQSMGGTLALMLANKYKDIAGIILINPALSIPKYEHLIEEKTNKPYINESKPDINKKGVYEITYDKVPLSAIYELQKLMKQTRTLLPSITCPVLCFKSKEDHVVPPENSDAIIEQIASIEKKVVVLHHSFHVASMDNDKQQIVKDSHQFICQQTLSLNTIV
ncbi:alpha/beta hydrolase [Bacillus aquiflavi]|uniref:alpha/beta hydrolase n=1 Tax=Bacillus aquiflavi TaxID=2672567 RepID=UPI002867E712|nr:alpha/beta hydrolase [Bacillus aquiflavi]